MRSFRFRLDWLLERRRVELDRHRIELSHATGVRDEHRKQTDAASRAVHDHDCERQRALDAGIDALALRALTLSRETREAERVEVEQGLRRSETQLVGVRERMRETWQGVRSLERIRQRALAKHRRRRAKRGQRAIDEMGTRGHGTRADGS